MPLSVDSSSCRLSLKYLYSLTSRINRIIRTTLIILAALAPAREAFPARAESMLLLVFTSLLKNEGNNQGILP